jgi:hypothetical protein
MCSAQNGVMYFYDNFLLKLTLKLYKYITWYSLILYNVHDSGVTADIEFLSLQKTFRGYEILLVLSLVWTRISFRELQIACWTVLDVKKESHEYVLLLNQ